MLPATLARSRRAAVRELLLLLALRLQQLEQQPLLLEHEQLDALYRLGRALGVLRRRAVAVEPAAGRARRLLVQPVVLKLAVRRGRAERRAAARLAQPRPPEQPLRPRAARRGEDVAQRRVVRRLDQEDLERAGRTQGAQRAARGESAPRGAAWRAARLTKMFAQMK